MVCGVFAFEKTKQKDRYHYANVIWFDFKQEKNVVLNQRFLIGYKKTNYDDEFRFHTNH